MAKARGPTSHDVVDVVRRALGERRVGHLGTLDPFAEGVLVIVVGRATRLAEYTRGWTKAYEGTIRLGVVTTTDDLTGTPVTESDAWRAITPAALEAAAARFVGAIAQRPPAYSAVKVDGERAYRRARRGDAVSPAPRAVTVHAFALGAVRGPDVDFRAEVSGGTYLRSLARDFGEALGCGAHLAALRRTRVGPFTLARAVTPEAVGESDLEPPAVLVADLPRRELDAAGREAVIHGRPVPAGDAPAGPVALFADGALVAVGVRVGDALKPRVVVAAP